MSTFLALANITASLDLTEVTLREVSIIFYQTTASIQKFQTSLLLNTITTYYSYQDYTDCFDIYSILMCKILKARSQGRFGRNRSHV